jgi:hypothetical protein
MSVRNAAENNKNVKLALGFSLMERIIVSFFVVSWWSEPSFCNLCSGKNGKLRNTARKENAKLDSAASSCASEWERPSMHSPALLALLLRQRDICR